MLDHRIIIGALVLLLAAGIFLYPVFSGMLLIAALLMFGALSYVWKEKETKLMCLAAIVLVSILNIGIHGMKFGIDFYA